MRVRLPKESLSSERAINRTLEDLRPLLRKSKSSNTGGGGDPDMQERELAFFNATNKDLRLVFKYNGRYWYFVADSSKAPLNGTTVVKLTDNSAGTANDTIQALTDPADTPLTADALRDDLVANLIPELRNNFADLAAKINEIRTVLVNIGYIR